MGLKFITLKRLPIYGGVLLRIWLIVQFVPAIQENLFGPFIQAYLSHPKIDPWGYWLEIGGAQEAFPYGPIMLLYFAFWGACIQFIGFAGPVGIQIGIACGLLIIEFSLWAIFQKLFQRSNFPIPEFIALSPIVIYATYIHGQLDLVPSSLIFISLIALYKRKWTISGLLLGIAIATKLSALLVLPLIFVYFIRNKRYRSQLINILFGLIPGIILTIGPLLLPGYRLMVLETPQTGALFNYSLSLGSNVSLLVAPLILVIAISIVAKIRRASLGILISTCGTFLSFMPLFMPSSPGWYLWGYFTLIFVARQLPKRHFAYIWALSLMETAIAFLFHSTGHWRGGEVLIAPEFANSKFVKDLLISLTILAGTVILFRIFSLTLKSEDPYSLVSRPLSILVAGDSGTGKDTLCASLADVFGESRCAFILGDDYHSFERGDSAWSAKTHLHPGANDITRLTQDSLQLLKGEPVWSRHYDHDRGRFTQVRKISSGEVIAISGLHALSLDSVRKKVDLSVFLDMDENLRKFLKVKRDSIERNQSPEKVIQSLSQRAEDRENFIQPQTSLADLVLSVRPSKRIDNPHLPTQDVPVLDVVATFRGLTLGVPLVKSIIAISGAQANLSYEIKSGDITVTVKAADWISSRDVDAIASNLFSNSEIVLGEKPKWLGGSKGICQLFIVASLLEKRQGSPSNV